jgi:succinate dehydrogenase / fumarate reductase, iron-sulfur subunit
MADTSIVTMRIWRGDATGGGFEDHEVEVSSGEVVLDVLHRVQATRAPDLAVRWNCKAGRCGSCSAEVLPGRQGPRHRRLLQLRDG